MRSAGGVGSARKVAALQRRVAAACNPPRQRRAAKQPRRQARTTMIGGRIVHGSRPDNLLDQDRVNRGESGFFGRVFGGRDDAPPEQPSRRRRRPVERLDLDVKPQTVAARRSRSSAPRREPAPIATKPSEPVKHRLRVGSQRTVCVRLCDGFYFPINNRSHSDNFYEELAMCVGRCPGADVSLYVHHQDAPVESMRSTMTGERYVALPTAFTYRKRARPGCGCQPQTKTPEGASAETALASLDGSGAADAGSKDKPDPVRWTPMRAVYDGTGEALDPLLTNRSLKPIDGSRDPRTSPPSTAVVGVAMPMEEDGNAVREVGPRFFPEEEPRPDRAPVVTVAAPVEPEVPAVMVVPLPETSRTGIRASPRLLPSPDGEPAPQTEARAPIATVSDT